MGYGQRPGNTGHRGNWRQPAVRSVPQCRYGQRHGARGAGRRLPACYDPRGRRAGGDRGWRPPRWRHGRQRYEQWNQQRGYPRRQYPQLLQRSQSDSRAYRPPAGPRATSRTGAVPRLLAPAVAAGAALIATVIAAAWGIRQRALSAMRAAGGRRPPRVA